jgi:excisionase family DNA binding protein
MSSAPRPVQLQLKLELPLEDTIDVFTAARVARCSTDTIRRWCDAGRFPAFKLVGRYRIERQPFYAWISSRRIPQQ